jgi:CrcB protein
MTLTHILLVGAGGCIGSIARYITVISVDKKLNSFFPFGTIAVNVTGSFLLGLLFALLLKKAGLNSQEWRLFLGTGFCGGFTTFSAFAFENISLFEQKLPGTALLYIGLSVIGGLLAVWLGIAAGRTLI